MQLYFRSSCATSSISPFVFLAILIPYSSSPLLPNCSPHLHMIYHGVTHCAFTAFLTAGFLVHTCVARRVLQRAGSVCAEPVGPNFPSTLLCPPKPAANTSALICARLSSSHVLRLLAESHACACCAVSLRSFCLLLVSLAMPPIPILSYKLHSLFLCAV